MAAQVRQLLIVEPISTSTASSALTTEENMAAFFGQAGTARTHLTTTAMVPRFERFRDMQLPREFLDKVDKFCHGILNEDCVRCVTATALNGSTKLCYHFDGPFKSWDAFAEAFRKEFASVDEKL